MNIRRLGLMLALLFSAAAVIGLATPSSMAYVTAASNTLHNTFSARYIPPEDTTVKVQVQKTVFSVGVKTMGPEGFRFQLEKTDGTESFPLITGASGKAALTLSFTAADLGKAHVYRLYEINDGRENVAYSSAVYEIEITLSVNEKHQIVAAARMNGAPVSQIVAEFENIYDAGIVLPPTGDRAPLALYGALMILSGVGIFILLRKHRRIW